eukprot:CAMPEP_0185727122 /NCGR_PEP_ID=MMETSP1171-20130828/2899_1 /TAXON_ID=374046 /ORGANISM="Helicotheca tamensis, Strain CCMP826" /LENGTH=203 /DNA_ID=CAMNT_0028395625 /DNA_START=126 /DNA_END=737 /DNA_ORIENTATION=-
MAIVRPLSTGGANKMLHLVINAVGNDRPGIVSDITKAVVDAGGNVGDSQAAKLGSHFSLMMLVSVPENHGDLLKDSLDGMSGMNTSCFETNDPKSLDVHPKIAYSGQFTLSGADNPGIVHQVTSVLAKHKLSIDKMETSDEEAPFGGTQLFNMRGIANAMHPLASGFDADKIKDELQKLGESLNCDIDLEDISSASLDSVGAA